MSNPLQILLLSALLAGASSLSHAQQTVRANSAPAQTQLLAALPITYGLTAALIDGSSIQLERAAPANLPGSRQPSYFAGRGAGKLQKLASEADAVVSLRSSWQEDSLYPLSRRSNIRIIEIDAARPVDNALPGIAVKPNLSANGLDSQPWLEVNNMGRMADIIAADLVKLQPDAKDVIEQNLSKLKHRLLQLSASSESKLAEIDNLSVVSLTDHFQYLIGGLNLEQIPLELPASGQWDEPRLAQLTDTLRDYDVAIVLSQIQPSAEVVEAIAATDSTLVVLDSTESDPVQDLEKQITAIISALAE